MPSRRFRKPMKIKSYFAQTVEDAADGRLNSSPAVRQGTRPDGGAYQSALAEEIGSRFTVDARLGRGDGKPRVVALVGPPGSGKTTTLVKLAIQYGLASRRPA